MAAPPPWHDPAALLPWYRDHYRSDISKPPSRRDKLPDWLLAAQGRAPVVSTPATPSPAPAVPSLPPLAMPEAPLSAEVMLHGARSIVALKKARFDRDPNDPAAAREYFEAVEKLQGIEGRARKAGATDDLPRQRVCDLLDTLHARIPRRFTQALTAAFPDARRALSTDTPGGDLAGLRGTAFAKTLLHLANQNQIRGRDPRKRSRQRLIPWPAPAPRFLALSAWSEHAHGGLPGHPRCLPLHLLPPRPG